MTDRIERDEPESGEPAVMDRAMIRLRKFLESQHPQYERVAFRFGALEEILQCRFPEEMKLSAQRWTNDQTTTRRGSLLSGWRVDKFIPGCAIGFARTRLTTTNA
ncbi:MAG: hypothetical protein JJE05_05300 [Actinobacteria bacterium]|nr:hypothetical protein [Actinomycetota bacterium]